MHQVTATPYGYAGGFEPSIRPLLGELRGAALRLTRNRSDADDLVQDTVLRAFRFWHRYQPGTNLRAWIQRILRNTFITRYRRAQRERELAKRAGELWYDSAEEALAARPGSCAIDDALQSRLSCLSPPLRAVLWAVAVEELSYREAAANLGCPIGTIMSRLHRARCALQAAQPALLAPAATRPAA